VLHCLRRPAARSWGKRVAGCPSALHGTSQESTSRLAVRRPLRSLPRCQRAVIVLLALVSIAFALVSIAFALVSIAFALAPLIHSRAALLLDAAALLLDAATGLAFVAIVALSRLAATTTATGRV